MTRPTPSGASSHEDALASLLGESAAMTRLRERVARILPTEVAVLVEGETGTGKELLARAIHDGGPRRAGPFVPLNCGALAADVVDSELFGHERGAFTGALTRRPGRAAEAHGGTLFLDEVGELPLALQCKLLRLLQEGEVQRVGSDRPVLVDVRVVAATNRRLHDLVAQGLFRADCYYRLAACTLEVPPLRDRGDDVVLLARCLLRRFAADLGRPAPAVGPGAAAVLARHAWPGNVRELENIVRACVLFADVPVLGAADLRAALGRQDAAVERGAVPDLDVVLRQCGGNVTQAARGLGISRPTLYKRLRARALDPTVYRGVNAGTRGEGDPHRVCRAR